MEPWVIYSRGTFWNLIVAIIDLWIFGQTGVWLAPGSLCLFFLDFPAKMNLCCLSVPFKCVIWVPSVRLLLLSSYSLMKWIETLAAG